LLIRVIFQLRFRPLFQQAVLRPYLDICLLIWTLLLQGRADVHSIPRLQHHRRLLGIPNPFHQLKLAVVLEQHWAQLEAHMNGSTLSMTRLEYIPGSERGLKRAFDFDDLDRERIVRSSTSRFLLKADLSRFYHSLYTHSIPWALHSKAAAKANFSATALFGNAIDIAVRNTQDKQTLGIPVGPVTSDLISEVLGTALDIQLAELRPGLKGLRYVDDYYLFFATRSEAEGVLADLHGIANHFAVEINPLKTNTTELPEPVQPSWKSALRSAVVRPENEREDLMSFFSRAYDNASKYPGNNVLKYAVKHSVGFPISHECWALYESFLLGSLEWPNQVWHQLCRQCLSITRARATN
jgi:Reverse transcriptase (RNA-dependent DNA polymerase)